MESIRPFLISLQETLRSDCVNDADDTASEGEDMHVQAKSELTKRVDALLMQLGSRKHQMVFISTLGYTLLYIMLCRTFLRAVLGKCSFIYPKWTFRVISSRYLACFPQTIAILVILKCLNTVMIKVSISFVLYPAYVILLLLDTPAQVLIRGADVLHRLTKGVCQVQETVKALFERSENTLQ